MACAICSSIPLQVSANTGRDEMLPKPSRALRRLDLRRSEDLWECPACESLFVWEDLSSWTGSGHDDTETLTRLTDVQAGLVRSLLRGTARPDPFEDTLFALPGTALDLALEQLYQRDRELFRACVPRMVNELAKRTLHSPNAYCLRDLLSRFVDKDPADARRVLSAIETTPYEKPHLLDQIVSRCRRSIAR